MFPWLNGTEKHEGVKVEAINRNSSVSTMGRGNKLERIMSEVDNSNKAFEGSKNSSYTSLLSSKFHQPTNPFYSPSFLASPSSTTHLVSPLKTTGKAIGSSLVNSTETQFSPRYNSHSDTASKLFSPTLLHTTHNTNTPTPNKNSTLIQKNAVYIVLHLYIYIYI